MARPADGAIADVICNDDDSGAALGPAPPTAAQQQRRQLSDPRAIMVEAAVEAHAAPQQRGRKRRRTSSTAAAAPPRRRSRRRITAPAQEDIIDLTAEEDEEDAVAHAFRQWELIDLTSGGEAVAAPGRAEQRAAAAPAPAAAAPPAPVVAVEDALAAQRASIRAFLAARGAQLLVRRCEANPHAAPGAPLYERFVAARARCADPSVALAFHGTPEANVQSICARGLDPRRRKRQVLGAAARRGRAQGCSLRRAKTPQRAGTRRETLAR
jgi:hypothetical protein